MSALRIPADFIERNRKAERPELAAHYGVDRGTITRWRVALGIACTPRSSLPMPKDFAEHASHLTLSQAAERWDTTFCRLRTWYRKAGLQPKKGRTAPIPAPADLAQVAAVSTIKQMTRHYGRDKKVVRRWLKAAGLLPAPRQYKAKPAKPKAAPAGEMRLGSWQARIAPRDHSMEGQAAEHLRTLGYCGVYHCNERGGFDTKGKFWRAGNVILTPDELLERARRLGWNPDAWQEVKAA